MRPPLAPAFHGIGAFRVRRTPLARYRAYRTVEELCGGAAELACAEVPVGHFGVLVAGVVSWAASEDAWSEMRDDGSRYPTSVTPGIWGPCNSAALRAYCREQRAQYFARRYREIAMRPRHIIALWVTDKASPRAVRTAETIARHRDLPWLEISQHETVWQALDADRAYLERWHDPRLLDRLAA